MKRFFAFLLAMCLIMGIFAQNSKLSYQAVVRNSANELVTNANITVDLSIANSISGDAVFSEKHTLTTNQNGLVSLMIGNGSNQTGNMSNVTWATAYITSDYTLPGGTHVINTVPVSAVPYALYADTVNEHSLANYLTSHHYATTSDVTAQVNADWNATEGAAEILNKPDLFSGDYNDLTNKPTLFDGNYNNLTNKPTIPTNVSQLVNDAHYVTAADVPAQVNADWNATEGAAEILNKPDLFSGDYNDLTNKPTLFDGNYNSLTDKPTIPTNVSQLVNDAHYVTAADVPAQVNAAALCDSVDDCILGKVDARRYLTSDSTVIGNMQNGIAINIANITTLQSGLVSAIDKEKNDSLILAGRINTLENASMDCDDVKSCIKDTLSKYTTTDELTILLQQLADRLAAQDAKIDTLRHLVDSLTKHTPGVTTTSVTSITQNTATSGGNVTADGGANVTARGVCWSTSQNPTIADSHTTDGSGTGSFTSSITGLISNTTYYVRAYVTSSEGTAYGNQVSFTTVASFPCGTLTVTDYDNNTYSTVQIGSQCWMKENLRTTRYADGTSISLGSSTSTSTAYRYYPNGNSSNVSTYGYLYNLKAVMRNSSSSYANPSGVQGICPNGWHVPSDAEWRQLTDYVSSQSRYVCGRDNTYIAKALASTTGWNSADVNCAVGNNPSANNATGFSAVPAGMYSGNYDNFGNYAYFWSATQMNQSDGVYTRLLHCNNANVNWGYGYSSGYSVRCLRD